MIQEQIHRKKRIISKGKNNKGEEGAVDPPIIEGTLEEIDRALARSESILRRPTEKTQKENINILSDVMRQLSKKQKKGNEIVYHRTCSC